MPVKRWFTDYGLDTDSRCNFCNIYADNDSHIFCKCTKLNRLWDFLDEVLGLLNIDVNMYSFVGRRQSFDYDCDNTRLPKSIETVIVYINYVVNINIWRDKVGKLSHRNLMKIK